MKCRLHYVLITYLCRSKYTPHTAHTHPTRHTSHLCREPSNALHTLRRPSGKFLKHMCSLPPSFQAVPTSSHISLSLSPIYLAVDGWELPARFSLLGALVLAFLFAVRCFRLSSHFGLPAIDLHSVNMPTPSYPPAVAPPFKDKLNQFPIDRVMRCFFCSIFPWTLPELPA